MAICETGVSHADGILIRGVRASGTCVYLALRTRCHARDCSYIHVAAKIYMLRACETSIPFFLPLVIGFVDRIAARGRKAVDQFRGAPASKRYEQEAR